MESTVDSYIERNTMYIYIYILNTKIKRIFDTLIKYDENKTTKAFEHYCVLAQWCTGEKCE